MIGLPQDLDGSEGAARGEMPPAWQQTLSRHPSPISAWSCGTSARRRWPRRTSCPPTARTARSASKCMDAVAAAVILEGYLAWRKNSGKIPSERRAAAPGQRVCGFATPFSGLFCRHAPPRGTLPQVSEPAVRNRASIFLTAIVCQFAQRLRRAGPRPARRTLAAGTSTLTAGLRGHGGRHGGGALAQHAVGHHEAERARR